MVVRTSINLVRLYAVLAHPVVPETSDRILDALGATAAERGWPRELATEIGRLEAGRAIAPLEPLFRRIADEDIAAWFARFSGSTATSTVQG
jgi:methionyl-tRNA synthetase